MTVAFAANQDWQSAIVTQVPAEAHRKARQVACGAALFRFLVRGKLYAGLQTTRARR
jgi:hypothetical protein